jgi:hypothetical protein
MNILFELVVEYREAECRDQILWFLVACWFRYGLERHSAYSTNGHF